MKMSEEYKTVFSFLSSNNQQKKATKVQLFVCCDVNKDQTTACLRNGVSCIFHSTVLLLNGRLLSEEIRTLSKSSRYDQKMTQGCQGQTFIPFHGTSISAQGWQISYISANKNTKQKFLKKTWSLFDILLIQSFYHTFTIFYKTLF